ncbi:MAG: hypothetical protein HUJ16_05260 [Kangiella sp.]|nr:hypothetical protein [Kangiella sp.]
MMISTINEERWGEIAHPVPICSFSVSVDCIEKKLNVEFFEYNEDGLGKCYGSFVELNGYMVFFQGFGNKEANNPGIQVYCRSFEKEPKVIVAKLTNVICEKPTWVREELSKPNWLLYRLDDNGNEVLVNSFLDESSALFVKDSFDKKRHKQTYYVKNNKE